MADELERRREECIQLRTLLSSRTHGIMQPLADDPYGGDTDMINEDGELQMAYKTQKDLNKWVVGMAGDGQVGVALGWCINEYNRIQTSWQYRMVFICFLCRQTCVIISSAHPNLTLLGIYESGLKKTSFHFFLCVLSLRSSWSSLAVPSPV